MIVYITIGNSDDKLGQREWSQFVEDIEVMVRAANSNDGVLVHGRWHSLPNEPWQNACWCLELPDDRPDLAESMRGYLAQAAKIWQQESIAWAETSLVAFLGPSS